MPHISYVCISLSRNREGSQSCRSANLCKSNSEAQNESLLMVYHNRHLSSPLKNVKIKHFHTSSSRYFMAPGFNHSKYFSTCSSRCLLGIHKLSGSPQNCQQAQSGQKKSESGRKKWNLHVLGTRIIVLECHIFIYCLFFFHIECMHV